MTEKKDTFCPLPWNHLATHPNGSVSLCCKADTAGLAGFSQSWYPEFKQTWRLARVGFPVIHNSESFCQTRSDMLNGQEPLACKGCYDVERAGGRSKRQTERLNWPDWSVDRAAELTDPTGRIKTEYEFIELRLGNKCNLKCATCNPISSDQWSEDYDQIATKLQWVDQKMTSAERSQQWNWPNVSYWVDDPRLWKELYQHSSRCKKIYINGGEPMLNLGHIDYLRLLVSSGRSKDIDLVYSTNVTAIPKEVLHDVWTQFKSIEINASVDSVGPMNTHIRFPSSWEKIERTLAELQSVPNIKLTVIQTISAYNFFYFEEFNQWIQARHLRWWVNHVDHPTYLSAKIIPLELRLQELERVKGKIPQHIWHELVSRYSQSGASSDHFIRFNDELDRVRSTNWRVMFKKLAGALNE